MTDNNAPPRPLNIDSPTVPASDPPIPQSSAPLLDYHMFPHLMDMIIANAEPQSLVVLRRTSWEMCERADAALARHLVVSVHKVQYTHSTFRHLDLYHKRLPCLHRLVRPVRVHLPDFDRIRKCLGNAEVFELLEDVCPDHFLEEDPLEFAKVHTLKYHPVQEAASSWSRGVYKDLEEWLPFFPRVKTLVTLTDVFAFPHLPSLADSLERVVIKFCELEAVPVSLPVRPFEWPANLAEVVFLCHEWGPAIELSDDPFEFIYSLIDASRPTRIRFTFVDLHYTDPGDFHLPDAYTPDLVEDMISLYIKRQLRQRNTGWTDDDVTRKAATVEFISIEQYRERVGPDQAGFESYFEGQYDRGR